MVGKIKGKFVFSHNCPETRYKKQKVRFATSLLVILMGIFLLPNLAYLSSITPEKIIELTNLEREKNNAKPLRANRLLNEAAFEKASAILETQTFQHTIKDKKFSSWIKETGYDYSYVGENLAIDFATAEGVVTAWINSEAHKSNLLNPRFTEIGIATIEGKFEGEDTIVVAQIFGEPIKGIAEEKYSNADRKILATEEKKENKLYSSGLALASEDSGNKKTPNQSPDPTNTNFIQPVFISPVLYLLLAMISISFMMAIFYLYIFHISRIFKKEPEENFFNALNDISDIFNFHKKAKQLLK